MNLMRIFPAYRRLEADLAQARLDFQDLSLGNATLTDISARNGTFNVAIHTEVATHLADRFGDLLKKAGGENYLEMHFNSRDLPADERLVLTLKWCKGKSPHELRKEAEDKLAEIQKTANI